MKVLPPAWAGADEEAWQQLGCPTCAEQEHELERLRRENERLRRRLTEIEADLECAQRAGKRQAAPFSKGKGRSSGRRPGRRPGEAYGQKAYRAVPKLVDREVEVGVPSACPHCGGAVREQHTADQYQEELPAARAVVTHFRVHVGHCVQCGRRVQGRHPEQTSDALGAAASQLGPRAVALATHLNKTVAMAKTAATLRQMSGITLTPGGVSQALDRVGRRAGPTYDALVEAVRHSPVVAPDETGWKVGGDLHWLWDFVGDQVTVYSIQPGRGFKEAAAVLGKDFAGVLERDGWAPYRQFTQATHQTCNAHLIRRCREMLQTAQGRARHIPLTVKQLLQDGMALRDQRDAGQLGPTAVQAEVIALEERLDTVLAELDHTHQQANRRLLKHLAHERQAVFTYLHREGVQATNWRAEQGIRPAVVNRKVWGGNRTPAGAHTQEVLASVLRTCQQQARDPALILADLLRSPIPVVAPLHLMTAGHT